MATFASAATTEVARQAADDDESGVINPYALAELVAGRKIAWDELDDCPRMLEQILQTPYEELFDPKHGSPLYAGSKLNDKLEMVRDPIELPMTEPERGNDLERSVDGGISEIRRVGDLQQLMATSDLAALRVDHARARGNTLELRVRMTDALRHAHMSSVFDLAVLETILPPIGPAPGFNPPGKTWLDGGDFFEEATEFSDPIQGAIADCYLIAALASVAWARPYDIQHRTRAKGQAAEDFVDRITFFDIDNGNARRNIEVTEKTLHHDSSGLPVYCRSSEAGEIWPAVYEKAYAKWKTGTSDDRPDIRELAFGSSSRAMAEITGLAKTGYKTVDYSAAELVNFVKENSFAGRTINPMTAGTYSSGEASPDGVVYAEANLVARHAYSVLGWLHDDGRDYIVLRNPWGRTEATYGELDRTIKFWDVSWWRPIVLSEPDGVFAIRASVFKSYFSGLAVVK